MTLTVNNENIDITLEEEKTIGDVLRSFESEAAKNDATTTQVSLNGNTIPVEEFDKILDLPLEEDTVLDLSVVSRKSLKESLKEYAKLFSELNLKLMEVPVLLQSGNTSDALAIINELSDTIFGFCRTTMFCSLFPGLYAKLIINERKLDDFFADFTPILKDFEDAMANDDTVTVGDLAEYEIGPRLKLISDSLLIIED